MNKEDSVRIAKEVGFVQTPTHKGVDIFVGLDTDLERFATIVASQVAAAERKRLADAIEAMPFGDTAASFAAWIRDQS